ncbi:MAG: outer membrane protein transport protein [Gemmatimonadaceae bacterium]|jgi:long-chain fatty acid transport protein|nr:outer membrane protein transport protein [Gemmatimonadaceae bacterium]
MPDPLVGSRAVLPSPPRRPLVFASIFMAVAAARPHAPLAAQGYGLYEQGACAMARGGAAAAAPCADGSTMVFNPAGLAGMPALAGLGSTVVVPGGTFTNGTTGRVTDLERDPVVSPNLYLVGPMRWGFTGGLAVYNPYGLSLTWAPNSEGRFVGSRSVLRVTQLQPTLATRVGPLSIGGGLNFGYSAVRLQRRLDLAAQQTGIPGVTFGTIGAPAGTDFADVNLTANDWAFGWNAGLLLRGGDRIALGARYLSRQTYRYRGGEADITRLLTGRTVPADVRNPANPSQILIRQGTPFDTLVAAQFAPDGLLADQQARTILRTPEQAVVGVMLRPAGALKLLFDAQWTNWEVFDRVRLDFERLPSETLVQDYRATWSWRTGVEYEFTGGTAFRLGWASNEAAAPAQSVTPVLPEAGRNAYTAGLGAQLSNRLRADVAYMYLDQRDRRGRTVAGDAAQNNGTFRFDAHLVNLSLAYAFSGGRMPR